MRIGLKTGLTLAVLLIGPVTVRAEYKETLDANAPTKNLGTDYGLVDDSAQADQSEKLRKVTKFFDGPSIGAVRDTTGGAYRVIVENVTLEGFEYNADKKILTPSDARPGKWAHALKKWKVDRGISVD